jgi:hypothetical protein
MRLPLLLLRGLDDGPPVELNFLNRPVLRSSADFPFDEKLGRSLFPNDFFPSSRFPLPAVFLGPFDPDFSDLKLEVFLEELLRPEERPPLLLALGIWFF